MKRHKKIRIVVICIVFIMMVLILIGFKLTINRSNEDNLKKEEISVTKEIDIYNPDIINEVKKEINATGNTQLYQVYEEYDGRKILQIRSEIQFETALVGILKNAKPLENEIQQLLNNQPTKNGIWIAKQARVQFLNLLKENKLSNYEIDENGYLYTIEKIKQKESEKLDKAIQSDKLYILDMSGTSYIRDEMSGEITEYPFEKMDPYQILDKYEKENKIILEITTNASKKLSNEEILKEILSYF